MFGITLPGLNDLGGPIPAELGNLAALTSIDIRKWMTHQEKAPCTYMYCAYASVAVLTNCILRTALTFFLFLFFFP